MGTEVCTRCGRLFDYQGFGGLYCHACRERDTVDFDKVRTYINQNGRSTIFEVVEATGIPEKYVKQYLREGRLEIPESSNIFIKCESCGCDIRSGRYCPECGARLSKGLKGAYVEVGEKPKVKDNKGSMHFIGRENERGGKGIKKNK